MFIIPSYEHELVEQLPQSETVDWGLKLVEELRKRADGEGTSALILDTGVDDTHVELQGQVIERRDFTGKLKGQTTIYAHGTNGAAIISAKKNNTGLVGVAPKSKLYDGVVLYPSGTNRDVARGVNWMEDIDATVANLSLGSFSSSYDLQKAIDRQISKGKYIVAAAGNSGNQGVTFPGNYSKVITVGSTNQNNEVSDFSSIGNTVDIVAPGEGIYTATLGNRYARVNGTSFAAPFVTGVILLLCSIRECKSQAQLEKFLKDNAKDILSPGFDAESGAGIINVNFAAEDGKHGENKCINEFIPKLITWLESQMK